MFQRFTDRARRVVVLAQQEARMLNHDYIGTEHILLALIREGDGVAAQVLLAKGVDIDRARAQVVALLRGHHEPEAPAAAADDLLARLASFAARLNAIELRLRQSSSGSAPS